VLHNQYNVSTLIALGIKLCYDIKLKYQRGGNSFLYLNGNSFHHKSQRNTVISTLALRANAISDQESLPRELAHLKKTLLQNGYKKDDIRLALKKDLLQQDEDHPRY